MGYRTDVDIVMFEKDYENILTEAKKHPKAEEILDLLDIGEKKYFHRINRIVHIRYTDIKWYYDDVIEFIEEHIHGLEDYAFSKIGENLDDIEYLESYDSDDFDVFLEVSRSAHVYLDKY